MYSVNGVDLQSSEFEFLKKLVNVYTNGESVLEFAKDESEKNPLVIDLVRDLINAALLRGLVTTYGVIVILEMKQAGIDFVHDYYALKEQEEAELKQNRRHDYKVASYGAVAGGVLGLFSGAFGGSVIDAISALF